MLKKSAFLTLLFSKKTWRYCHCPGASVADCHCAKTLTFFNISVIILAGFTGFGLSVIP